MQLGIPFIAVDDAKAMPQVVKAIDDATGAYPRYARLSNPFFEHDARGIVFVRARIDNYRCRPHIAYVRLALPPFEGGGPSLFFGTFEARLKASNLASRTPSAEDP